jgi:ABC-type branched-subunit amino acid transport system ATPase component
VPTPADRPDHLPALARPEGVALEVAASDLDGLRAAARGVVGIGEGTEPTSLQTTLYETERSELWWSLWLAAAAAMPFTAIALLGVPLARQLGGGGGFVVALTGAALGGFTVGGLLLAPLARSGRTDGTLLRCPAAVAAAVALTGGFVLAAAGTPVGGMAVAGLGAGLAHGLLPAWLVDRFVPGVRTRLLLLHRAAWQTGVVVATGLLGALAYGGHLRVAALFAGLAVLAALTIITSAGMGPAAPGWEDTERLRRLVGANGYRPHFSPPEGGHLAAARSVVATPTTRALMPAFGGLGVVLVVVHVELMALLRGTWTLGPWGAGTIFGAAAIAGIAGLGLTARGAERRYRSRPERLVTVTAAAIAAGGVAIALAGQWRDTNGAVLVLVGVALLAIGHAGADSLLLTSVRPTLRVHASALATVLVGAGGLAALALLTSLDRSGGAPLVLGVLGGLIAAAAIPVHRAAPRFDVDVDAALDGEVERAELDVQVSRGVHLPLLACRRIDFSYGKVQVLFDVTFTVDDSEMVALLGTNGAGKSTLLRVISGLGLPSTGSVRVHGRDITRADPPARVRMGITQIPGGKAAFGPMSVADNLRMYGYSLGRNRRAVDAGIEQAFAQFPRLADRRNQTAQTLSGGERQMLALSKALILKPRLLLIDELSLGLAPAVVGELLEMVRAINERGTAVVLVEQSVNVALSLVHHAYYLEKGEVRFDGPATELVERPDILRSVYLQGAAKGLGS